MANLAMWKFGENLGINRTLGDDMMKKIGIYAAVIGAAVTAVLGFLVVLASFGFMLVGLTGCSADPQLGITLAAVEMPFEDEERMANELYQKSHAMPEVLATTMSAFPTLAKECGMRDVDAKSIDWTLSCEPNGGEVQVALLEKLLLLLSDSETEITFYTCTGAVTRQVPLLPETGDVNPITVEIAEAEAELESATVMAVKVTYEDGITEVGYYDTTLNYARILFDEVDVKYK